MVMVTDFLIAEYYRYLIKTKGSRFDTEMNYFSQKA